LLIVLAIKTYARFQLCFCCQSFSSLSFFQFRPLEFFFRFFTGAGDEEHRPRFFQKGTAYCFCFDVAPNRVFSIFCENFNGKFVSDLDWRGVLLF